MKITGQPIIAMQATLTLDHEELTLLNRLCQNSSLVIEVVAGKNALPEKTEPWMRFFGALRQASGDALDRFRDASAVFEGRKVATEPAEREAEA